MRYLTKLLLALVLLCVTSTGNAQVIPGEPPLHAGPTTSKAFGSIITNPFGSPSTGDQVMFATPHPNCVLLTDGSSVPSCSTTLPNGINLGLAQFPIGSAAVPSLSVAGDTTTGLYQGSAATGTLSLALAGSNFFTAKNSSTVPGFKLGTEGIWTNKTLATDTQANEFDANATGIGTGVGQFTTALFHYGVTNGTLQNDSIFQQRTIESEMDVDNAVGKSVTFVSGVSSYIRLGFGSNHSIAPFPTGDIAKATTYSGHVANESIVTPIGTATGMANNGSGLIRVTVPSTTGLVNGQQVHITGTVGTTEANGFWSIANVTGTTFDLTASTFTNAWVSGGDVTTGGTITYAIAFSAEDFDFEEGTTPPTSGVMRNTAGLKVGNVGHATRVTDSASGIWIADQTGGAPNTQAILSEVSAGTNKYFLRSTGDAVSSIRGAVRVGFVGPPSTVSFDAQYQPGTLPSGVTTASQFYTETSEVTAASSLTNVLNRVNMTAGTQNIATLRGGQVDFDIANSAGTITTMEPMHVTTTISGTPNITTLRNYNSIMSFTGAGGTTTEADAFYADGITIPSTHAVTTSVGFKVGNIGNATRVTNAIGLDITDITTSATLTAGIRSVMSSGTGKWFINHTGTAASTFGGNVTLASTLTYGGVTLSAGVTGTGNMVLSASPTLTGTLNSSAHVITSSGANAFAVGPNGVTTPLFRVDASTASAVAGLKITGAATGGTVALALSDSGSNTNLTIDAKGTGTIGIGSVSTGIVTITPAVTMANAGVVMSALASDATHTDATVCKDTTTNTLLVGSGASGICLGTSSVRYKDNVVPLRAGLDQIDALQPVSYRYKNGYGTTDRDLYGFTAEQVYRVMPELVGLDKDGRPNSVDWAGIVPVLVRAVQELKADNDNLRYEIVEQRKKR